MDFPDRHIGPGTSDVDAMLEALGYPSLEAFIDAVVPAGIKDFAAMDLPAAASETQALAELESRMESV